MTLRILALTALQLFVCLVLGTARSVDAQQVRYYIHGYGSRHAIIVLNGSQVRTLNVNPNADGLGARISGVGVTFAASGKQSYPGVISSSRVVQRGAFTDLVLNFDKMASLNVTGSSDELKVFVKVQEQKSDIVATATPGAAQPTEAISNQKSYAPIRFLSVPSDAVAEKPKSQSLLLNFPEARALIGNTAISTQLRWYAYLLDIAWAWLSQQPLTYANPVSPIAKDSKNVNEEIQLDQLVEDLTKELVEVRAELSRKENALRTCK